jgi:hypothetical protein
MISLIIERNAVKVLPVPVGLEISTFLPSLIGTIANLWGGLRDGKFRIEPLSYSWMKHFEYLFLAIFLDCSREHFPGCDQLAP